MIQGCLSAFDSLLQRVLIVGSRGPVEINPRDLMGKESSITGVAYSMCYSNCLYITNNRCRDLVNGDKLLVCAFGLCFAVKGTPAEFAEIHEAIQKGLANGSLRPVVGKEYRLEEAVEAHKAVIDQSGGSKGKIVLTME